jgi:peptide/nickel transport system substrate-binding protein
LNEEPTSLIPGASPQAAAAIVDQAMYAPLFYGDESGVLHPGLASELPTLANGGVSADLTSWTFHLRPGLRWTDGQPEDARDVDFTWRVWTNPKFPSVSTVGLNLIRSAEVSRDHLAITFHLTQGFEPFLAVWADAAAAPLPAHQFSRIAPEAIVQSAENLKPSVTSGPFLMQESKPGDHYTVVRNPNYYQAAQGYPYLDRMIFRVVPDQNTLLKDLQNGPCGRAPARLSAQCPLSCLCCAGG